MFAVFLRQSNVLAFKNEQVYVEKSYEERERE
jgi:hypothetical protein